MMSTHSSGTIRRSEGRWRGRSARRCAGRWGAGACRGDQFRPVIDSRVDGAVLIGLLSKERSPSRVVATEASNPANGLPPTGRGKFTTSSQRRNPTPVSSWCRRRCSHLNKDASPALSAPDNRNGRGSLLVLPYRIAEYGFLPEKGLAAPDVNVRLQRQRCHFEFNKPDTGELDV